MTAAEAQAKNLRLLDVKLERNSMQKEFDVELERLGKIATTLMASNDDDVEELGDVLDEIQTALVKLTDGLADTPPWNGREDIQKAVQAAFIG